MCKRKVQTINTATGLMAVMSLLMITTHSAVLSQYLVMLCTLTLYAEIVLLSAVHCHISLLFLDDTISVIVNGTSCSLFELGLGIQLSWYLDISKFIAFQLHNKQNVYFKT